MCYYPQIILFKKLEFKDHSCYYLVACNNSRSSLIGGPLCSSVSLYVVTIIIKIIISVIIIIWPFLLLLSSQLFFNLSRPAFHFSGSSRPGTCAPCSLAAVIVRPKGKEENAPPPALRRACRPPAAATAWSEPPATLPTQFPRSEAQQQSSLFYHFFFQISNSHSNQTAVKSLTAPAPFRLLLPI